MVGEIGWINTLTCGIGKQFKVYKGNHKKEFKKKIPQHLNIIHPYQKKHKKKKKCNPIPNW